MAIICYPSLNAPLYGNEKREPKNLTEDESIELLKINNQNEKTIQTKQQNIDK